MLSADAEDQRARELRLCEAFGLSEAEMRAIGARYLSSPPAGVEADLPFDTQARWDAAYNRFLQQPEGPVRSFTMADLLESVRSPKYTGPDIFDVAPPGVHALLAYRNVHRFTGVLDGAPLAVQE